MELSYLGSPYSHPDPFVREWRYLQTAKKLAQLLEQKIWTFSPIVHCHELKKICGLPAEHNFWLEYDAVMLTRCNRLLVLCLPDWEQSLGLGVEMRTAASASIPIEFLHPDGRRARAFKCKKCSNIVYSHFDRPGAACINCGEVKNKEDVIWHWNRE